MTIDQNKITEAVRAALTTAVPQVQFHNGRITATPTIPYVLLYPLGFANIQASLDGVAEDGDLMLQISSVGGTPQQCAAVQSRVFLVLMAKTGSHYNLAISGTGVDAELWRDIMEIGAVVDSGENTYRSDDTYLFRRSL